MRLATLPGSGGFACRSNEYFASAAVSSWPLENLTPFCIVPDDSLRVDDLVALDEGVADVQLRVPLEERVVHELVALVVGREDAAERRDVARILLERPGDRAAGRNLLRRRTLRGRDCRPGERACDDAPAPSFPAFASSSRRLIVRSKGELSVGFSDIAPPVSSVRFRGNHVPGGLDRTLRGSLEDLPDARGVASDVVVER